MFLLTDGSCFLCSRLVILWIMLKVLCVTAGRFSYKTDYFSRGSLPFKSDQPDMVHNRKQSGCVLGENFYQLGAKWSPILEPYGVMFCIKCVCLKRVRKGRLLRNGKVICQDIRKKCPEATCSDPKLLPGRCCKTCPGKDEEFEEKYQPHNSKRNPGYFRDEAEHVHQEYMSLLNGKHLSPPVKTRAVAHMSFWIENNQLSYGIRYAKLRRPKYVRFVDANMNVLYQQKLAKRRGSETKVCGVWGKISPHYFQFLRKGKLHVVLTTAHNPNGEVMGKITPYPENKRETFSSLLLSPRKDGAGGVAFFYYSPERSSLEYTVVSDGLFPQNRKNNKYFVTAERKTKIVYQNDGKMRKKENIIRGRWTRIDKRSSSQLARGRLKLRITSKGGTTIIGRIRPRLSCSIFKGILSTTMPSKGKAHHHGAGWAKLSIEESGKIRYTIKLLGIKERVKLVKIGSEHSKKSKGRRYRVHDVTRNLVVSMATGETWINGTLTKLRMNDIHFLLNNFFYVIVASSKHRNGLLSGRVISGFDSHDIYNAPQFQTMLYAPNPKMTGSGVALASVFLDSTCLLHYDVLAAGDSATNAMTGYILESIGGDQRSLVFDGKHIDGRSTELLARGIVGRLSDELYKTLDDGTAILQINFHSSDTHILQRPINISNDCWRMAHDSHDYESLGTEGALSQASRFSCYYEGKMFEDGNSWLPVDNSTCNTCSCKGGKVICHSVVCPIIRCARPVQKDGECCRTCLDMKEPMNVIHAIQGDCYYDGDKRWHKAGSTWYPYVPGFGYSKCATCQCVPGTQTFNCSKTICPELNCPVTKAYRVNPDDCCQVCPSDFRQVSLLPQHDVDMEGSCSFAGDVYKNGESWNPVLGPFGTMRCIDCVCENAEFTCKKQKCRRLKCKRKIIKAGSCCPICAGERGKNRRKAKGRKENKKRQRNKATT